MSFWTWLTEAPNHDGTGFTPGEVGAVDMDTTETFSPDLRSMGIAATPWDGWPLEWSTPYFANAGGTALADAAFAALDLNASVVSTMPVQILKGGEVQAARTWMVNPDDSVYSSWEEFAKQLVWDYQCGEVFILAMARDFNGFPTRFRVVPPTLVDVEMTASGRVYTIGSQDVTDEILHVRYQGTTMDARGHGPLEAAGARMTAATVLAKYMTTMVESGGAPHFALVSDKVVTPAQADATLARWKASRASNLGLPVVLGQGMDIKTYQQSAREMALTELAQFNESRIVTLLGVPPFILGLPSGGDSMTYSNVSSLFDFHSRASLGPKSKALAAALSNWLLPRGTSLAFSMDEYTRPSLAERTQANGIMAANGVLGVDEWRAQEKLTGDAPEVARAITGGAAE